MSALPYGVMWITAFIIPMSAEVFIKRNWLTTASVRKICQIIGKRTGLKGIRISHP